MAPKRAAKKAPPPPPPPAESSDEEEARSSSEDESEEEEAIADSPVGRAPTSTLLNNAPALLSSEEEEEEDRPVRAPPTSQPPPPQEKEDSDTSGSDDDDEPAPKKQPPPAPKKKPGPFNRIWSAADDIRILEYLAAHRKEHGALPRPEALLRGLDGKLDNPSYASKDLQSKVKSLRTRSLTLSRRAELPSNQHDRRVLDLSKIIWGHKTATRAVPTRVVASNGQETKGFEEMCELYPYLAEEVKALEAARPGMYKRAFGKMDDGKACAMDDKIKRQRVVQIKSEMRRADLAKEVTKALVDLVC